MLEFGMDIGVKVNSMQAFVLARNRYSSGSQLYFVRWGSELYRMTPSRAEECIEFTRIHPFSCQHGS